MNESFQFEDSTYLELNEEHLARFLEAIERRVAMDNARAEALLLSKEDKKMRAASACARCTPAN